MTKEQQRWLLVALMALMALLQIAIARRQCLWADEIFSLAIATGHSLEQSAVSSQPEMGDFVEPVHPVHADQFRRYLQHDNPPATLGRVVRAALLSDTSPPFYYLLLYGWTLVCGTSDLALRLFSIVWSVASLPLMASIARWTGGRRAVLPGCILFAFSPLALYYSTEGRMYSLLLFLLLATFWLSLRLQIFGGSIGHYLLWIVASAAGLLTHYFFLFPWLALLVYLTAKPGRFERRWLLGCILLSVAAVLPWYWLLPDSLGRWRITQDWLNRRPPGFHRLRGLANQTLQFFSTNGYGLWSSSRWSARAALLLFAGIAGWMVVRARLEIFRGPRLLLWLWFAAACLAPSFVDLLRHTYMANVPRYALAALPAAYLLVAVGLSYLGGRLRFLLLTLVLLTWVPPVCNTYRERSRVWEPFREAAQGAGGNALTLILVHSIPSGVLGIARYANGADLIASWVGQLGTRTVPASLAELIAGHTEVCLIKLHDVGQPAPEEDWLRKHGQILKEKHIGKASIVRFRPKGMVSF